MIFSADRIRKACCQVHGIGKVDLFSGTFLQLAAEWPRVKCSASTVRYGTPMTSKLLLPILLICTSAVDSLESVSRKETSFSPAHHGTTSTRPTTPCQPCRKKNDIKKKKVIEKSNISDVIVRVREYSVRRVTLAAF